jgi:hypothetical protein
MALGELKNGIGPDAYAIYQQVLAAVVERDHPVGSLYISENATSPAELYGGTWERIEGRFIMGASDTYPAGSTGGSATHTQTEDELVRHKHGFVQLRNGSIEPFIGIGRDGEIKDKDNYLAFGDTVKPFDNYRIDPKEVGGGQPMDILNPYYSAYIWRRVA